MKNITLRKKLLTLVAMFLSLTGYSQVTGTHFTVTLANVTSTSNALEFDVMLTIDGTADASIGVKMSAMSVGINYNTGIVNGGTLSCAYIGGKSAQLSGLVNPASPSTVTAGHIRVTGSPLTIENSFDVVNGAYTFGRYRLTNTANWTSNSNAQLWLQPNNIGRTNTAVNAFPYGVSAGASYSYSTTAPAGSPGVSLGYTQAAPLTAILNVSAQDCATVGTPSTTPVTCFGGTDGTATITMSALTPSVAAISYTIDGGASQNATLVSGAFTIAGLAVGTYSVIVSNAGCPDVSVSVTVSGPTTPITNVTNLSACDNFLWDVTGLNYTASGTYTGTSTNLQGCTVNETLNLTITTSTNNTTTASACDSYTWSVNATAYTSSGTYTYVSGCHTETLELTITPSTTNTSTVSACDSYTWSVNATAYTSSGTYTYVSGCHTETLELTITPSTTNTTTASACDTYTWSVNATAYTSSGTYTYVSGCHTEILELTITPSTTNTSTVSACDTYTWSVNATAYTSSGTYTYVSGCHTETLELTITPSTTNTSTVSACDSYTWSVNATAYTSSGTYTYVSGCHTETLELTITPSTTNTSTVSACDTYTWSVNATAYTSSGTYTYVSGCHTEILELTINSATTPTGASTQTISVDDLNDATLEDLVVSPTTVVWYASLADAQNQVNPLAITTILTNGATYYAVNFASGCPSTPFAVTVTVALSVNGFDNENFSFYPNPTSGVLNISYSNEITNVTLINVLGQIILTKESNQNQIVLDLSSLPAAAYFVKVVSNGKSKVIKIIKED